MQLISSYSELVASKYRARSAERGDRFHVYYRCGEDEIAAILNYDYTRHVFCVHSSIFPCPSEGLAYESGKPDLIVIPAGTPILAGRFEGGKRGPLHTAAGFGLDDTERPKWGFVSVHEQYADLIRVRRL
jgi:hypothetical protein